MLRTVSQLIQALENRAPSGTAEEWDNVGLLAGDPAWKTAGAVVSVDLTPEAIRLARAKGFRLIVNHHPCIFPKSRGLSRVVAGSSGTRGLVFEALQKGIAVAAYHTNFDRCSLEVVRKVSQGLGVVPQGRLLDKTSELLLKLVVYVPGSHLDEVRTAICDAGAGQIGDYDSCTFVSRGQGTFRGGPASKPFLGKPGMLEVASEYRLETILPRGLRKDVVKAMLEVHPYEEVAYDLFAVEQPPAASGLVKGLGYGFWGEFPRPRSFSDVSRNVKRLFKVNGFLVTQPHPKRVKKVAFVAGKGASFIDSALAAGCDLLITGESGYHPALDGLRRGIAVMEIGHRESEIFFLSTMRSWLSAAGLKAIELNRPTQKILV